MVTPLRTNLGQFWPSVHLISSVTVLQHPFRPAQIG